ncbi:MAG: hypothetical protein AB8G05_21645 [Oligoflexales bacterium]
MGQLSHDSLGQVIRDWVGQFCATEWVSLKVIEHSDQKQYMCKIISHVLAFIPKALANIEKNLNLQKLNQVFQDTLELKGVLGSIYATKSLDSLNIFLEYVKSKDLQRVSAFKELRKDLKSLQIEANEILNKERKIS